MSFVVMYSQCSSPMCVVRPSVIMCPTPHSVIGRELVSGTGPNDPRHFNVMCSYGVRRGQGLTRRCGKALRMPVEGKAG